MVLFHVLFVLNVFYVDKTCTILGATLRVWNILRAGVTFWRRGLVLTVCGCVVGYNTCMVDCARVRQVCLFDRCVRASFSILLCALLMEISRQKTCVVVEDICIEKISRRSFVAVSPVWPSRIFL